MKVQAPDMGDARRLGRFDRLFLGSTRRTSDCPGPHSLHQTSQAMTWPQVCHLTIGRGGTKIRDGTYRYLEWPVHVR